MSTELTRDQLKSKQGARNMSNRFRPPGAAPPAQPAKTPDEILDLAMRIRATVEDFCQGQPADANAVLAAAYLSHCRALGLGREHIMHTLDMLERGPEGESKAVPS